MQKIRPHLWYDTQAEEAAKLYTSTFPNSRISDVTIIPDTPSGDTPVVSFALFGQDFQAISAGPLFHFTPSISFLVLCETEEEVDGYWRAMAAGGTELMPLDSYPHSKRYSWTQDRYGLSWQLMLADGEVGQRIVPTLMYAGHFAGKAEEAITFYAELFDNSSVGDILRYGKGEEPDSEGTVRYAGFELHGQQFAAMDSARMHDFTFNEAISLMVSCDDQQEIDRYWDALSAVPESEQCGWLKDRYGVSWQIVPSAMDEMLRGGNKEQVARVTEAFVKMKKFDIAELERAAAG